LLLPPSRTCDELNSPQPRWYFHPGDSQVANDLPSRLVFLCPSLVGRSSHVDHADAQRTIVALQGGRSLLAVYWMAVNDIGFTRVGGCWKLPSGCAQQDPEGYVRCNRLSRNTRLIGSCDLPEAPGSRALKARRVEPSRRMHSPRFCL
jgi:hypothetical protein